MPAVYRERKNKVSAEAAKQLAEEGDREEKAPERINKTLAAFGAVQPGGDMEAIREGGGDEFGRWESFCTCRLCKYASIYRDVHPFMWTLCEGCCARGLKT